MNNQFRFGVFASSVLVFQMELALVAIMFILGFPLVNQVNAWGALGHFLNITGIGLFLFLIMGHVKARAKVKREIKTNNLKDLNKTFTVGLIWRMKQEVKYCREFFKQ